MLGFVYRTTKPFKDNSVLLTLYKSLVRSRLEYCSSIWCPSQQYLIDKIERVQKRLVRWLCFRDKIDYDSFDYTELCFNYKLQTLESRRNITDLCNLNKVYNNHINSPYIVSQIVLNVPDVSNRRARRGVSNRYARRERLFSADSRIILRKDTFIPRVLSLANSHKDVDIFEPDKEKFKRRVTSVFSLN